MQQTVEIIPAVDVLGGEAVRLRKGDFDDVTIRAGPPVEVVRRFAAAGASLVHLVDLDGARAGRVRPGLVSRAAAAAGTSGLQASGGIRSLADANALLAAGASRVVVGTAAFEAAALDELVAALGDRLVVALDVRGDSAVVAGWRRSAAIEPEEATARFTEAGVTRLLCTAVERDGTRAGPDLALLERVRSRFDGTLIAAGGVGSTDHLDSLAEVGVEAAIVGSALLDGRLSLSLLAA